MFLEYDIAATYRLIRNPDGSALPLNSGDRQRTRRHDAPLSRVLVVDDERLIADTVTKILNLHGYDAFCAYSGEEALKLAESFRPDYLLTDVMMPVLNGVDLALAMERMLPSIKVMLFSGQAGSAAVLQAQENTGPAFTVVAKPIHPEKLVQKLRALVVRG
jgi:CheY-like chemotaxis protein